VVMRPAVLAGGLGLSQARVGGWYDEKRTWPARLELEGFVYETINGPDAMIEDRLRSWLPRNSFLPQPYEQLAGVYRRQGDEPAARAVAIGKQRARRAEVQGWARWPSRAWSAPVRWTIGYGYRPVLALIPWLVLLVVGSVLFQAASHDHNLLHPAKKGPEQPSFDALRYTADLLLPVANFKQTGQFRNRRLGSLGVIRVYFCWLAARRHRGRWPHRCLQAGLSPGWSLVVAVIRDLIPSTRCWFKAQLSVGTSK
jgi:hypothetical protein